MPDKNNQGSGPIRSRSAQSGQPDDKERDSTQRGDDSGQEGGKRMQSGKQRDQENESENDDRGQTGNTGREQSDRNRADR